MSIISQKICTIGNFAVGKTSLIRRFVESKFSDNYLSTVGVKISRKIIDLQEPHHNKTDLKLQFLIWDIEGKTKFKGIAPSYLQGAKGAIVVADVTRQETILNLQEHIDLFFSVNPKKTKIIVAFNKSDLVEPERLKSIIDPNQIMKDERIIATYATSAKTGNNVDEIFYKLAKNIIAER